MEAPVATTAATSPGNLVTTGAEAQAFTSSQTSAKIINKILCSSGMPGGNNRVVYQRKAGFMLIKQVGKREPEAFLKRSTYCMLSTPPLFPFYFMGHFHHYHSFDSLH